MRHWSTIRWLTRGKRSQRSDGSSQGQRTALRLKLGPLIIIGVAIAYLFVSAAQATILRTPTVHPQAAVLLERPLPTQERPVTLQEAWDIAFTEARARVSQPALVELRSLGVANPQNIVTEGTDGRRASWEAIFVSPDKPNSHLVINIVHGVPVSTQLAPRQSPTRPIRQRPSIDTDQAVRLATAARPGFGPANDKLHGFGFILRVSEDDRTALVVVGRYRDYSAKVELDAISGSVRSAEAYVWSQGGVLYSTDAGNTWRASNLVDGQVTAVAVVPDQSGVAYAAKPTLDTVELWKTTNGGQHWTLAGKLPEPAGSWAYGDGMAVAPRDGTITILVGTPAGLWVSTDEGVSWQKNGTLPEGPPQWLSVHQGTSGPIVTVAITAGENSGLYVSANLNDWEKILDGAYRLSPTSDHHATVAVEAGGANVAYLIQGTSAKPFSLSVPALRAAGDFGSGEVAVVSNSEVIAVSRDGGSTWVTSLRSDTDALTNLAVSPGFPEDGVILAGTFRGKGIFRSADHGQTWQRLALSLDASLAGSGTVSQLAFLSRNQVIAVSGGIGTWKGF